MSKRAKPGRTVKICRQCGTPYTVRSSKAAKSTYCSRACLGASKRGCRPHVYIKRGQRRVHTVIAELQLGRKLLPNEVAHHKDENKHNNDPANIEVKTRSQHTKDHWAEGTHKAQQGPRVARVECVCAVCGAKTMRKPSRITRFCSHACRNKWLGDSRRRAS